MKLLLTALLFLCTFTGFTQKTPVPVNEETGKVAFADVVEVPGVSATELYQRAIDYSTFLLFTDVISGQDKHGPFVRCEGYDLIPIYLGDAPLMIMKMLYNVTTSVKDGSYRYEFTDLRYHVYTNPDQPATAEIPAEAVLVSGYYNSRGKPNKMSVLYKKGTVTSIATQVERLKKNMAKPVAGSRAN